MRQGSNVRCVPKAGGMLLEADGGCGSVRVADVKGEDDSIRRLSVGLLAEACGPRGVCGKFCLSVSVCCTASEGRCLETRGV